MTPEDYLRQYVEPVRSWAGSGSAGDWQALLLEPDYYYPPDSELMVGLDALNRTELLEIVQRLLAAEYPQQRLSKARVQEFLEAFQRLKDERAWRQAEMERLAAVLAQYQSDHDRIMAELVQHQSERQQLAVELEYCRSESAVLNNEVKKLHVNLEDFRTSTSWKLTKPLRWFGRLIKTARVWDV